ncbi:MAG: aa3-type cytochrome c oxidase subunit IV [Sphingobium sp.]
MNPEQNYRAAAQTYSGFIGLVKWGTIGCLIVAAIVVLLISQ